MSVTMEGVMLSAEQEAALHLMLSSTENIVLTGKAGAGKSTLVKALQARIPLTITATTGAAAMNVRGVTVDSLFSLDRNKWEIRNPDRMFKNLMTCATTVVVDEASMIGYKMAGLLDQVAKDTKRRLILVGDFAQAAPVKDGFAGLSRLFREARFIKLTECHRQSDPDFLAALNDIRLGNVTDMVTRVFRPCVGAVPDSDEYLRLYATNATADAYNQRRLSMVNAPVFQLDAVHRDERPTYMQQKYPVYDSEVAKRLQDSRLANGLQIKVGARVLLNRNVYEGEDPDSRELVHVNGDTGTVEALLASDGEEAEPAGEYNPFTDATASERPVFAVVVRLDRTGEVVRVKPYEQDVLAPGLEDPVATVTGFPIQLGWAITTFKAQGMTLNKAYVDMDSICYHPQESRHGLAYVALSRTRTLSGLVLSGWRDDAVFCHPDIKAFI